MEAKVIGNESDRWARYHSDDGFFPMAAGPGMHAAVQREKRKIKIVSNESGAKKFLLNRFCRHRVARRHFSAAMDVLALYRLTHLTTDHQKFVSRTFNK